MTPRMVPCEPLTVVDANISITPNGTNRVGATHTFTATVNVNDGNGFTTGAGRDAGDVHDRQRHGVLSAEPADRLHDGRVVRARRSITSLTTGVTVVSAHTTLAVGGVTLTRHTDSTHGSSGPATKTWVNAKIAITPDGDEPGWCAAYVHGDADEGPGRRSGLRRFSGCARGLHADEHERGEPLCADAVRARLRARTRTPRVSARSSSRRTRPGR